MENEIKENKVVAIADQGEALFQKCINGYYGKAKNYDP